MANSAIAFMDIYKPHFKSANLRCVPKFVECLREIRSARSSIPPHGRNAYLCVLRLPEVNNESTRCRSICLCEHDLSTFMFMRDAHQRVEREAPAGAISSCRSSSGEVLVFKVNDVPCSVG